MTRLTFVPKPDPDDQHRSSATATQAGPDSEQLTGADLGIEPPNPFADSTVVSSYMSAQAVMDGILVDVIDLGIKLIARPVTFLTTNLAMEMCEGVAEARQRETIAAKLEEARAKAKDRDGDGYLLVAEGVSGVGRVWFGQNEVGGYTAMLPSDY